MKRPVRTQAGNGRAVVQGGTATSFAANEVPSRRPAQSTHQPTFADFHVHSRFSRATSSRCVPAWLCCWAQRKGIQVVGTGDFSHPAWLSILRSSLEQAEGGLYRLSCTAAAEAEPVPPSCAANVLFIPTTEISSIFKRAGKVHKMHSLIVAPDLAVAEKIHHALGRIGNVSSDGRPILRLDPRDLLELVMAASPDAYLIPAHIWTPWFSMLGSKSGFDSADECFGDYVKHVFAVETGLSSDPPMNWRVSSLDRFTLVSNSDCHSSDMLGRECTVFHCAPSYAAIRSALVSGDPAVFGGTIEFFPEQGKYHLDGHRACGVRLTPAETKKLNGICPVCGKPVTVGVLNRVEELADRPEGAPSPRGHSFQRRIGLRDLMAHVLGVGAASKKVSKEYHRLLASCGPELRILRETDCDTIATTGGHALADAIHLMRQGSIQAEPGFDGQYGVIRVVTSTVLCADRAANWQ